MFSHSTSDPVVPAPCALRLLALRPPARSQPLTLYHRANGPTFLLGNISKNCTSDGWSEMFPDFIDACGFHDPEDESKVRAGTPPELPACGLSGPAGVMRARLLRLGLLFSGQKGHACFRSAAWPLGVSDGSMVLEAGKAFSSPAVQGSPAEVSFNEHPSCRGVSPSLVGFCHKTGCQEAAW